MAHFRGTLQGHRGEASRLGTKESGFYASIKGWTTGVDIRIYHHDGFDKVVVYRTSGSNGGDRKLIAKWEEKA